jgi:hypothetical protein
VFLGVALALGLLAYAQDTAQPPESKKKAADAPCGEDSEVGFDLNSKFAAILVKVEINKKAALMILDTGSSRTILDSRIVDPDSLEPHRPVSVGKGSGISDDGARWGKATLQVGTHLFRNHRVVVLDMRDVSRNYQQQIDGLLGQDVLCEFDRVVLDFGRRKIAFGSRKFR